MTPEIMSKNEQLGGKFEDRTAELKQEEKSENGILQHFQMAPYD